MARERGIRVVPGIEITAVRRWPRRPHARLLHRSPRRGARRFLNRQRSLREERRARDRAAAGRARRAHRHGRAAGTCARHARDVDRAALAGARAGAGRSCGLGRRRRSIAGSARAAGLRAAHRTLAVRHARRSSTPRRHRVVRAPGRDEEGRAAGAAGRSRARRASRCITPITRPRCASSTRGSPGRSAWRPAAARTSTATARPAPRSARVHLPPREFARWRRAPSAARPTRAAMSAPLLEIRGLVKDYQSLRPLRVRELSVDPGRGAHPHRLRRAGRRDLRAPASPAPRCRTRATSRSSARTRAASPTRRRGCVRWTGSGWSAIARC